MTGYTEAQLVMAIAGGFVAGILVTIAGGLAWLASGGDEIDDLEPDDCADPDARQDGCTCHYLPGQIRVIANDCPVHGLDDYDRAVIIAHLSEGHQP